MAQAPASRYNLGVSSTRSFIYASLLALGVALLTLVPYAVAQRVTPDGLSFSGFLLNPLDGFSYLSKMRQGMNGAWLLTLPYAAEPGPPALLFTFYVFLGHIAGWMQTSCLTIFHAARVLAVLAMGALSYLLLRRALPDGRTTWLAYAMVLLGSGLGWLAGPAGLLSSDLLIPESIPLAAGLVNPHFPLAIGLVAGAAALGLRPIGSVATSACLGLILGAMLGAILPFAAVSTWIILTGWMGLEWWLRRQQGTDDDGHWVRRRSLIIGLGLGALPWVAYDYWLTRAYPVLSAWNAQNQTPSPPPTTYVAGFGLVLLFAVIGAWQADVRRSPAGRMLLTWVVVNSVLLYAPFNLQRRFSLGLFLPLAALAALGLMAAVRHGPRLGWLPALVVALSLPSNILVAAAGVVEAASGAQTITLQPGEREVYRWAGEHLTGDPLVLASPLTGNRLPAYATVRVLAGHPFETPAASQQENVIRTLYRQSALPDWRARLQEEGISYVFVGPYERQMVEFSDPVGLPVAFRADEFTVFRTSPP
jgi:hypothetical protein